jgi:F-type H+-transporting ATPase subunit a
MKRLHLTYKPIILLIVLLFSIVANAKIEGEIAKAEEVDVQTDETNAQTESESKKKFDVKELILHHLADSYEWTLLSSEDWHVTIPLPVILRSKTSGWHLFLSSKITHGDPYKVFQIPHEGKYQGKIVELGIDGSEIRPLDLSLTKNAASLIISSLLLIVIFMSVSRSIKRAPMEGKKGFVGLMEMFVMMVHDDIIKPSVGADYKKYAPFLLTVFFFIFFNNLLGLLPFFPGGANVTGNIAVTMVLAIGTFLAINLTGTKHYYKDVFWPDVPIWLKVPFPIMPIIEIVGLFTKPFALMIRLFANIMGGHAIVLGLISIVFITAGLGTSINASMTAVSVFFSVFILFLELLVAFIQAYVFTLLSSVFIGMARN